MPQAKPANAGDSALRFWFPAPFRMKMTTAFEPIRLISTCGALARWPVCSDHGAARTAKDACAAMGQRSV